MLLKGFKFGMLLQLAVGPVCIFIFQMASLRGFYTAETGVLGVVIIDGLYILAAILGIASILDSQKTRSGLKFFGAAILFIFGLSTVLGQFNVDLLPSLSIWNVSGTNSVLVNSILLTASSPLTILFWAGVFSTRIAEESMKQKDMYAFGSGALISTAVFLTLIALAGSFTRTLLPPYAIQGLNIAVGFLLIYFGIRMVLKKV